MVCCHVSDDECYVRQGLTGTRFQLFVSGRFSGYQGQNTPEQAPLHRAQGGWRDSGFGGNYSFNYLQRLNRSASEETKKIKVLTSS